MISQEQLEFVASLVEAEGLGDHLVPRLRAQYPGNHFTFCMDDDITVNVDPVKQGPNYNLYLVGGHQQHCVQLTEELEIATGVVVAEVLDNSD